MASKQPCSLWWSRTTTVVSSYDIVDSQKIQSVTVECLRLFELVNMESRHQHHMCSRKQVFPDDGKLTLLYRLQMLALKLSVKRDDYKNIYPCGCCLPVNNLNCTGTAALLFEDHHFLIWKVEDRGNGDFLWAGLRTKQKPEGEVRSQTATTQSNLRHICFRRHCQGKCPAGMWCQRQRWPAASWRQLLTAVLSEPGWAATEFPAKFKKKRQQLRTQTNYPQYYTTANIYLFFNSWFDQIFLFLST